ncbi:MAG: hypothetical protein WCD38_11765 [Candidatus Tumulicola sp.]
MLLHEVRAATWYNGGMIPTPTPLPTLPTPGTPLTKVEAALESAWVTFVAIAGGMWIAGVAAGATTPQALLAYARANWIVWLSSNIIAPAIRFYRQPPA